ncbi:MAG: hypothetical protein ABW019_09010 [Chitinophagaceae bacterium]
MKTLFARLLLPGLLFAAGHAHAQQLKVFSKYNYYTTEKDVIILGDPGNDPAGPPRLSVYKSDELLGATDSLANGLLRIRLPLIAFVPGRTTLQYTVSCNDKVTRRDTIDIIRLRPKANEVKIDLQTGGLIADGLPFFPFGFYCGGNVLGLANEVTHGFTHMAPYQSNLPETFAERKAYMDRCAQVGMRVAYSVNSLIGSGHNGARGLPLTEEEKWQILKNEIIAFRDHPALLAWYINDEPDGQGRPPALLEKAYQFVHELDPYHPVSIVFMLPPKFGLYRHSMDIAMTDPYPIPGPVNMVEEHVQELDKLYAHEKSVWLVPQAFGGQEMWAREPTPKEIRVMTYIGLVNGAKGIQYYTHAAANLNPQSVAAWSACSDMAVEVQQMAGFLLSDEAAPAVTSSDPQTLVRAFVHNGDLLILAVNKENKPKSVRIRLAPGKWWMDSSIARLWFENRELGFTGGGLEDMIDAMSTRVYLVKGVSKEQSLIYPGNLTANPGFETIVSPGLPIGSNTKMSFAKKGDPAATFFADPRQHKEGRFSLRLTTPVDSGGSRIRLLPIVLKAGNSYRVSVWARAKKQDRMPLLRIGVEGPRQERSFTLSDDWQQYSFLLRSDSSWSAAIVNIDLVTAGTAWVDGMQVNADPVVSYSIDAAKKALVSLNTTMNGSTLKYRVNDGKEIVYTKPFLVGKAATVQARLYAGGQPSAQAALFVPVNKALGRPVTLASTYAPQYAGGGAVSLTDGLMASTAFKDNKWLGFLGKEVIATIDLQGTITVGAVNINFLCDVNSGIFLPPDLSLYTSLNGKDFVLADRSVTTIEQRMGEPSLQTLRLDGKKVKARYIRVVAAAFGEIPEGYLFKGTQSWIFTDEIMVE